MYKKGCRFLCKTEKLQKNFGFFPKTLGIRSQMCYNKTIRKARTSPAVQLLDCEGRGRPIKAQKQSR